MVLDRKEARPTFAHVHLWLDLTKPCRLLHTSNYSTSSSCNLAIIMWCYQPKITHNHVLSLQKIYSKFGCYSLFAPGVMILQSCKTGCVWKPDFFKSGHIYSSVSIMLDIGVNCQLWLIIDCSISEYKHRCKRWSSLSFREMNGYQAIAII